MPQSCNMGQTALLPLRRKACCGFFRPKNPTASAGIEPAILGTKVERVLVMIQRRIHVENRMPNISSQKMQVKTTKCYEQLGQESVETKSEQKKRHVPFNIQCNNLPQWTKTMPRRKGTAFREKKRRLVSSEPQFLLSK
jgi:hypothetical protein